MKMHWMYGLILVCVGTMGLAADEGDLYVDSDLDFVDHEIRLLADAECAVSVLAADEVPSVVTAVVVEPDVDGSEDKAGASAMEVTIFAESSDADEEEGPPMVESNYVRIYTGEHANAGSTTDYITMNFGRGRNIRLYGPDLAFPRDRRLTWDLNGTVVEGYPQDTWDEISFWTHSGDGIEIERIIIVHSGVEILDWTINRWLDAPSETSLGTGAMQLVRKLEHVDNTDHAAIHFAARELGKTDGYKYGDGRLWCSEFASWCLWKEGFWTPKGNIGTADMKEWFENRNRLYTRSQVTSESYVMRTGDYLSLWDGGHSALFIEWIDSTENITTATRFRTIEGNTGKHVDIRTRTVADIDRVGKAQ